MQSEFYNVALDRLRYSLVWEDHRTLAQALRIQPDDHVLVITSAGCNALNALLEGPRRLTALDLNPVQNQLLDLKRHVILRHDPPVLHGLMGFGGEGGVERAWKAARATLPDGEQTFWEAFFEHHPAGIATAGRLESYLTGFLETLDAATQTHLRHLAETSTLAEQRRFFRQHLDGTDFGEKFIAYFDEANLSRGRDPRLFRYAEESGGAAFYGRLRAFLETRLFRDSFFLRFFFFGAEHLPEPLLPPCYRARHYGALRANLARLDLRRGEAVDFLLSPDGQAVTKASLSNIFEYVSPDEFQRAAHGLTTRPQPLRAVFWNLLQDQGAEAGALPFDAPASGCLSAREGCFYFRNVRVLDSSLRPHDRPSPASNPTIPDEHPRPT